MASLELHRCFGIAVEVGSNAYPLFSESSIVTTQGGEVSAGLFARAVYATLSRKLEFKSERAPFFKLVPHLKDVVLALLGDPAVRANQVEYYVIFDDLDVGLKAQDTNAMLRFGGLLRLCRDYNKQFAAERHEAKIVVLLRDDIAASVSGSEADMGKLMQSYETRLSWFGTKVFGPDENNSEIKKFLDRRVELAFAGVRIHKDRSTAWNDLVKQDEMT